MIEEKTFSFTPAQLISIHRRLFDGIYKLAGRIRDYNITKNEWVLGGKTVYYASADTISETLNYDMGQEREFSYANMNIDDAIHHLTRFCANLWQVHAFCEGNTRTTAVFMIKYHERSKDVLVIVCFCSPFDVFMGFCFSRPAWPFCTQAQMS